MNEIVFKIEGKIEWMLDATRELQGVDIVLSGTTK
jgi:hypothetical protein